MKAAAIAAFVVLAAACGHSGNPSYLQPCRLGDGGSRDDGGTAIVTAACSDGLTCSDYGLCDVAVCRADADCAALVPSSGHSATCDTSSGHCTLLCGGDGDCPFNLRCSSAHRCE